MEQIVQITCQRCGHQWVPNIPTPVVCARCHSPYYRTPRKNGRITGHKVVQNTVHQEPLVTQTPQIQTPIYAPPPPPQYIPIQPPTFMGQPVIRTYPPVGEGLQGIDYSQQEPPHIEIERTPPYIDPDRDMPLPLRKCKLCGYKGYGEQFKNHNCRR